MSDSSMNNNNIGFEEDASCDLITVVSMGYASGVKKLLEHGKCDVNYVNDDGDTALMVAARRNDVKIMKMLIAYGANLDAGMGREYLILHAESYHNNDMVLLINNHSPK